MRAAWMLRITDTVAIEDWELSETFHRASGPGGQNVNKVSTAVALRFEAARSPSLPDDVKGRLRRLAGWRWTSDGALVVTAERHRSQALNREEARAKLRALILAALERPKPRRPTRPTAASVRRRLEEKARRSALKTRRSTADPEG
jgi:ribosome-associated protein